MSWWSILVICISRAAHSKSPKSCVLEATLAHPQVPGGSLVFTFAPVSESEYSSPILWRRWSCSRAHSQLCPERVEAVLLCQELPSAVQGMDGCEWGGGTATQVCAAVLRSLGCFGKWWQIPCCHHGVVTSLVMLICWAGCISDVQLLLAAAVGLGPKILLLLEGSGEVVWQLICWECGKIMGNWISACLGLVTVGISPWSVGSVVTSKTKSNQKTQSI